MVEQSPQKFDADRPVLLVLASTYPRWKDEPEPGIVHEQAKRLLPHYRVHEFGPHAQGTATREVIDGVEVQC